MQKCTVWESATLIHIGWGSFLFCLNVSILGNKKAPLFFTRQWEPAGLSRSCLDVSLTQKGAVGGIVDHLLAEAVALQPPLFLSFLLNSMILRIECSHFFS